MIGEPGRGSIAELFRIFLQLGLTSFGGPTAHIAYYREAFVVKRGWLSERALADLLAVAQLLPGPTSSQICMSIGAIRAGPAGAVAAWLAFTLPSAALMVAFAFGLGAFGDPGQSGWLAGLKLAALAVVANALLGMARNLAPDRARATIAVIAMGLVVVVSGFAGQASAIAVGALAGIVLYRDRPSGDAGMPMALVSRGFGLCCLCLFAIFIIALPVAVRLFDIPELGLVDGLFRTGALVFGGGHVVLPLLETVVVPEGWLDRETFVAGYGAAQALPGPVFAVSAFIGAAASPGLAGIGLGIACLVAIFLPGFLLVLGVLPFWAMLRDRPAVHGALTGVNAAVVGLLAAALYDPVWTSAIRSPIDVAVALAAFVALNRWKVPSWALVGVLAVVGEVLSRLY
jgi:chromate transporter